MCLSRRRKGDLEFSRIGIQTLVSLTVLWPKNLTKLMQSNLCTERMPGHITTNLCFCIQLDQWVKYCNLVHPGMKLHSTIFHAQVGPVHIRQKAHWDTLCQTCFFASYGICGSCSAFRWVQTVKH
jgi:hypothetical protein